MTDGKKVRSWVYEIVRGICTIIVVGVIAWKIYVTPMDLVVDFPTLLSLLLAMFSVALAALFYFKATETSNAFYDNTHKFTRDIAQLLAKMESGFDERLRHLDEGYASVRDHLQKPSARSSGGEVEETKKKIEEEQQEIQKSLAERDAIIANLIERSELQIEERADVARQLAEKGEEVERAQHELERMNRKLATERVRARQQAHASSRIDEYTILSVINRLVPQPVQHMSFQELTSGFDSMVVDFPRAYIKDLEQAGYYDDGLTLKGVSYLVRLASDLDT